MARFRIVLTGLILVLLAACGSSDVVTTEPDGPAGSIEALDTSTTVAVGDTDFVNTDRVAEGWKESVNTNEIQLVISNQAGSEADRLVQISVEFDGELIIDKPFDVGDWHNFVSFTLTDTAPGEYTITLQSNTGAELTRSFTKTKDPLWIAAMYWNEGANPFFNFEESDEPFEFA